MPSRGFESSLPSALPFRPSGELVFASWQRSATAAPKAARRQVVRPPYGRLVADIDALGYAAVGRRYGVSDNAIRNWRRAYEAEAATTAADEPLAPTSV